ncbi:molecular chaperone TorD family protein [Sulfurimonas sp. HSL-3221]|uniref:Molecular chaperone TorD family protein n=1 Tax=Sulfurimonas diazotrophicus TaxID=3131939 RepID=A0ABZ3HES3_9BACT|nr:molecular chaperone TorD family protein [Sulfurimonas sp. HSL-3221]UFS63545.1 molecular chaperone TorD family protein [Sulfurimonas sp. HSL-3221]
MEQTQARSNIYALLSRVLMQEADTELIDIINNDDAILEMMPNYKVWDARTTLQSSELIEKHLSPDFTNISLLHLIPYETFYTREDQMIETGGANPVTDMYSAYDFMVDFAEARVVSADHIGVEMEFMHHLCEAQIKAMNDNDSEAVEELMNVEREFLDKHLVRWAPLYLLNMKHESRSPLYYDAADMALEFILSDYQYLSETAGA